MKFCMVLSDDSADPWEEVRDLGGWFAESGQMAVEFGFLAPSGRWGDPWEGRLSNRGLNSGPTRGPNKG